MRRVVTGPRPRARFFRSGGRVIRERNTHPESNELTVGGFADACIPPKTMLLNLQTKAPAPDRTAGGCLALKETTMNHLYLAHNRSKKKIPIAFNTIVVRNQAIQDKYPGGMTAFFARHMPVCNDDITVCCSMCEEIEEVYDDLVDNGFRRREDFAYFDISREIIFLEENDTVESHVPWMRCALEHRQPYVWYYDGTKNEDQIIQERLEEAGIDPSAMDPEEYWRMHNKVKAMTDEIGLESAIDVIMKELSLEAQMSTRPPKTKAMDDKAD